MARRLRERAKAEIETGSFSDISFLLIIFFILSTTFSKPMGREAAIPSAAPPERQSQSESEDRTPNISVLPDRILLSIGSKDGAGREVTLPELKTEIERRGFKSLPEKDRMVVVEVADTVDWDRYFKVVSVISGAGGVIALVEGGG